MTAVEAAVLADARPVTPLSTVALWNELGRPWIVDQLGGEIMDLPRWMEEHIDPEEWEAPLWALSIWQKQAAKGRSTERTWARSSYMFDPEPMEDDGHPTPDPDDSGVTASDEVGDE